MFRIYYGAYSEVSADVLYGMIGDIGPFFYSNNYLKHISQYWRTSYFHSNLLKTDYVKLEFLFDDYTNVNEVKDRIDAGIGKIEGETAEYDGKKGIILKGGT